MRADRTHGALAGLAALILLIALGYAVAGANSAGQNRLSGAQVEDLLRTYLVAQPGTDIDMTTLHCARTRSYGDGDTANCQVQRVDGATYALLVTVYRDVGGAGSGGWAVQVDVRH